MKIIFGTNSISKEKNSLFLTWIQNFTEQKKIINFYDEKNNFKVLNKLIEAIKIKKSDLAILITNDATPYFMYGCKNQNVIVVNCEEEITSIMSRRHNNANLLIIGLNFVTINLAKEIIKNFILTPFDGGRHQIRIDMLYELLGAEC